MAGLSVGAPYKQFHPVDSFDAIVIGSGIGGLGTAALLARAAGWRVLVLERHFTAGGFTHVFHRPGFEWDVGVHYIGEVHHPASQVAAMFDYVAEERLHWTAMPEVYDRVRIGGSRFDYIAGRDRLREQLLEYFPAEATAIDRYFKAVDACTASMMLYYVEKVLPPPLALPLGGAMRGPFLRHARRTTAEVLESTGAGPDLRAVLTAQWGDYGLPPGRSSFAIHAAVAAHYFAGAAYPLGGAADIARSLLPTIERAGGCVVVDAAVDRVLVHDGRAEGVVMKDGREIRATHVISDAGVRTTLDTLLADVPQVSTLRARVAAIEPSAAHLCLYVGIARDRLRAPLDGSNLWIHPGRDFDRNWDAFAANLDAPFPLLFISFPSAKDPAFGRRYPGHETIEVVAPAPFEAFSKWTATRWRHRGAAYDALKRQLADRMLAALRRHVPQVEDAIVTSELSTPLSTRHFDNAPHGEAYGLAHTPARFELRDLRPSTPVRNFYLTGQDVSTCGVAGALAGAVLTASVVLRRNLFGLIGKNAQTARATQKRAA